MRYLTVITGEAPSKLCISANMAVVKLSAFAGLPTVESTNSNKFYLAAIS